jgi:hypothetical protein
MTDESVFREVDEEVRQDEYKKLWGQYGNLVMAVVGAVIIGVGGFQLWTYYDRQQAEQASSVYVQALRNLQDGKFDEALASLKAIDHGSLLQLAKMKEADVLAQKGETEKAIAAYDAIAAANQGAVGLPLADIAKIKAGYLLVDSSTPDQLLVRLLGFDKEGVAWRHQAREIFGLSAWRVKDYVMADRYFRALFDDPETPQGMRQRAQLMVQLLAPNLPKK